MWSRPDDPYLSNLGDPSRPESGWCSDSRTGSKTAASMAKPPPGMREAELGHCEAPTD